MSDGGLRISLDPFIVDIVQVLKKDGCVVYFGLIGVELPDDIDFDELVLSPDNYDSFTRQLAEKGIVDAPRS